MKFIDVVVFKEERFAIEKDAETDQYFVSFPVFNGMVQYSEFYKIGKDELATFLANSSLLTQFVKECREHRQDARLLHKPGRLRGEPC